jgi:2-polyprenyl-6-hydroxyphenyl methylase/3-demethylubiquinone-9 3-methyltransferase
MDISGYEFSGAGLNCSHDYLLPTILRALQTETVNRQSKRIFELGCGNGSTANELHKRGFSVTGVDPSKVGIRIANQDYPHIRICEGSTEEDLAARFGTFPIVLSLEVIEHVYAPRVFAKRVYDLLDPGGLAIISTPYNGYLKNLAIAILGKCDNHYTALWDNGHIKFWSMQTLGQLLLEAGFKGVTFLRVGRVPVLAKSMLAFGRKP